MSERVSRGCAKATVEKLLFLEAHAMVRDDGLRPGVEMTIRWMNERSGEVWATVKCSVRGGDVDEGRLDLALPSRNSVSAFIGQVSSRASKPLVVDAHAVSFRKCGVIQSRPLKEALNAAKFDRLGCGPSLSASSSGRGNRGPSYSRICGRVGKRN